MEANVGIYERLDMQYGPIPITWKGYFAGDARMLDHWWGSVSGDTGYTQMTGADILWDRAIAWRDQLQMFNAAAFTVEEERTQLARERFIFLTKTQKLKSKHAWMDPDFKGMAMNWIGILYEEEGNIDEALIWYKAGARRLDEGSRINLLRLYINSGEITKARNICKRMLPWGHSFVKDPFIPNLAKFFFAQILFSERDFVEAQDCYHHYLQHEVTLWFRDKLFSDPNHAYYNFGTQRIPLDIAGNETVISITSGFYPSIHLTFLSSLNTCAATPEQIQSLLPMMEEYLKDLPWKLLEGSTLSISSYRYEEFEDF